MNERSSIGKRPHQPGKNQPSAKQLGELITRLRKLIDHAADIIYCYRLVPRPQFEYVSPASTAMTGYTPEEHYSDPDLAFKIVHPDDRSLVESIRKSPASIQGPIILRWIRKDGEMIWTDHRIVPIRDESGQVTELVGIARDITQQKQLEDHLRQTQERLESEVQQRTAKLVGVNEALQAVIAERTQVEQELRLLLSITQAVNESENFHAALNVTLQKVCLATGWDYGEAWVPDTAGAALKLSSGWYGNSAGLERFRQKSEKFTFARGVGLAGRVWASRRPDWTEDISKDSEEKFPRLQIAIEAGLRAAFGIPIIADNEILAVLTFAISEPRKEDQRLVEIVTAVATQLGSAIHRKQMEDALQRSESLLRALVDNSTRVIYLKDRHGRYLRINQQYEKLFHRTREQVEGKTDYDLFPEKIAAAFHANDLKVIELGTPMEFEEVMPQDDGLHTYISNKFPMFDASGQVYAVCGISTDITEHKHTEEALRQAHDRLEQRVQERTAELAEANKALQIEIWERQSALERLREERDFSESLINTAQVIVLFLDPKGQIVRFNPYAEEILGYRLEEVRGKDWFTTFLPKRDQARIRALFSRAINDVRTRGNINSIITKDGREREIEWYDKTLKDANGHIIGLLSIGQDISERKKAETWLRSLINTTQDAVVSIDGQRRIVLFNAAAERIFGYTREEAYGQKIGILMADPYAAEHENYIMRYEQTGEARVIGRIRTVSGKRKNGEAFPVELSVTEMAADGEVRYAAFMRDVSENTRLQAQLLESERLAAIGSTAARIGHEIGNPLNGMYLTVQLLEQRMARQCENLDDSVTSTVKKIKEEIARLINLLQDLRTLSRQQEHRFKPTSLSGLVAEILELEMPRYATVGIRVEQILPSNLPQIAVDRDRLKQALINLFSNAAEAMPDGGVLSVRGYDSGEDVTLEIKDTGIGIPADLKVFEPFTTTKPRGTGLGLVIVRQVVSAHGGLINYSSEPKKGTTFRITLPRHAPQTQQP